MTAAKKVPAKKAAKPNVKNPYKPSMGASEMYSMPVEVRDWIERAQSTIAHLRGEVARLKSENENLRSWRRWAESRFTRAEMEK